MGKEKKVKKEKKKKHGKAKHKDKQKEKCHKDSKTKTKKDKVLRCKLSEEHISSCVMPITTYNRDSQIIRNQVANDVNPTIDPNKADHSSRLCRVPMTKEQYEREQSVVREAYDSQTGRMRLIKGSGEVIERIVSRSEHLAINANATRTDGASFLASALLKAGTDPNFSSR